MTSPNSIQGSGRITKAVGLAAYLIVAGAFYESIPLLSGATTSPEQSASNGRHISSQCGRCGKDLTERNQTMSADTVRTANCPPLSAKFRLVPHALVLALIKLAAIAA